MDDDNIAKPHEVETFVGVAMRTGAEILTCCSEEFHPGKSERRLVTPVGPDPASGFFWNCIGDANSFWLKSCFMAMGGFPENYRVGKEDYELLLRATLGGRRLLLVPEILFGYRMSALSIKHLHYSEALGHERILKVFLERVPSQLAPIIEMAFRVLVMERMNPRNPVLDSFSAEDVADIRQAVPNPRLKEMMGKLLEFERRIFSGVIKLQLKLALQLAAVLNWLKGN